MLNLSKPVKFHVTSKSLINFMNAKFDLGMKRSIGYFGGQISQVGCLKKYSYT